MKSLDFLTDTKYYTWYVNIVTAAQNRCPIKNTYVESHHIIPRCLGGEDVPNNLVLLTAKEHFVCHHLLTKFTTDIAKSKMVYAWWCMNRKNVSQLRYTPTANIFEKMRSDIAVENSKLFKGVPRSESTKQKISNAVTGKLNHMYGKKQSAESNQKRSASMTGITRSDSYIKNMSMQRSGAGNPMHGRTHTPEAKAKIAAATRNRHLNKLRILNEKQ